MAVSTTPAVAAPLRLLAAVILAATAAAAAAGTATHLHLYIHETFTGANATAVVVAGSSSSSSSSFGSVGAIDDELREGPDASSRLVGRAEGLLVQADLGSPAGWCATLTLVFTDGDYGGSTLAVGGRADLSLPAPAERAVVGGTGRFRGARGYSLMTKLGNPTPSTVVFEVDLYVNTDAI